VKAERALRLLWLLLAATCAGHRPTQAPLLAPALPYAGPESAPEPPAPLPLSLEDFELLIATPELKNVRPYADRGDHAMAAKVLEADLGASAPSDAETARRWFFLALLQERVRDRVAATRSYEAAAAATWPLSDYAGYGAARMLLEQGRFDAALARLQSVPAEGGLAPPLLAATARAAALARRRSLSIRKFREYLDVEKEVEAAAAARLELAELLLEASPDGRGGPAPSTDARSAVEALRLARRARTGLKSLEERATALETRALAALPAERRAQLLLPDPGEELALLQGLFAREEVDAVERQAAEFLAHLGDRRFETPGCEAAILYAKALASKRQWGRAADALIEPAARCEVDTDYTARALYLAGKYAESDRRYAQATRLFAELERRAGEHRLADDARLRGAMSYLELGDEARFTELLSTMLVDYPAGDMSLDGVFELALRRLEKVDWGGAARVLEPAAELAKATDRTRGSDFAGRERYFLARALMETGDIARGLELLQEVVTELPFSYYMLAAHSRLLAMDPELSRGAMARARDRVANGAFRFEHRPEFDTPAFRRALELLRLGEVELARRELDWSGLLERQSAPGVLWAVALLYEKAGSTRLSHAVVRGLLTDWLEHWPVGDWVRAWELAFPRPYLPLVARFAGQNGIDEFLAYAVMREESAFDPDAVSPADAYGLMQLIEPTARHAAKKLGLPSSPAALRSPAVNIPLGCRVLGELTRRFSNQPLLAIPGYNAGPGRPRRWVADRPGAEFDLWVEQIPFRETRRYTKRVLASRAAYAALYYPDAAESVLRLPERVPAAE
jgi:soluble lytic murein transglycosylase